MQSLLTLTVCTLYANIIRLVLFHNSIRAATQWITTTDTSARCPFRHSHVTYQCFACLFIIFAVAQMSVQENVGLTVESNRINRLKSIFWCESNINYFWRFGVHYWTTG